MSEDLEAIRDLFKADLGISTTHPEREFLRSTAQLITIRAARLAACGVGAICTQQGYESCHVGVEGSLFEKHPHFRHELLSALGEVLDWGNKGDSKDSPVVFVPSPGSGIGAAVIASTLDRA